MTLQKVLTKWIIIHGEGGIIKNINDILKFHIKQRVVRNVDEVVLIKQEQNDKTTYTIFNAPASSIINVSKTLWHNLKRDDIEIQDYYGKFINHDSIESRTDIMKSHDVESTTPLTIQTINKTNIIEIHGDIYQFSKINTDCMALLLRMDFNKTYYKWVNYFLPDIKDGECSEIINVDNVNSFLNTTNANPANGLFLIKPGFSKLKYIYIFHNERDIPINKDIDRIPGLINDCMNRVSGHQIKRISINDDWGETDKAEFSANAKELISKKIKLSIIHWLVDNRSTDIENVYIVN